jgi:hypothetical protein
MPNLNRNPNLNPLPITSKIRITIKNVENKKGEALGLA